MGATKVSIIHPRGLQNKVFLTAVPHLPELLQQRGGQTVRCVSVPATGQWTFIIYESLKRTKSLPLLRQKAGDKEVEKKSQRRRSPSGGEIKAIE